MSADEDPDLVELLAAARQARDLAVDVAVGAMLLAAPYAVPRRLRPAAAMAGAIMLSRAHGCALRRAMDR